VDKRGGIKNIWGQMLLKTIEKAVLKGKDQKKMVSLVKGRGKNRIKRG